ncbi:MAG: AAA family ATPase [Nitrospirota bacterium]
MYREYFGLEELPFSIAPDPHYLYMSHMYKEALAHLMYGVSSEGGFVLLTGEVGTGKTTVCRCLLEQLPEDVDVAFVLNPKITVEELLATICDELSIYYPEGTSSIKEFVDRINGYLLDAYAKGRKTILIIEEAQNLTDDLLEQVRLLTNLETNQCKLLQIIMIGQPELRERLARPELRQLCQRITARYHLGPLSKKEIGSYVGHRLKVAGAKRKLFPGSVMGRIYRFSRGIPRLINVICDRALLGAYVEGKDSVDKSTLIKAAHEVLGEAGSVRSLFFARWFSAGLALILIGTLVALAYNYRQRLFVPEKSGDSLAAVKTPEPVKIDTLQELDEKLIIQSEKLALQTLFKQWGIDYEETRKGSACRQAAAHGLQCMGKLVSFDSLIKLNRPVVLKLLDDRGQEFHAILVALEENIGTLKVGNEIRKVDIKEVERRWLGDYTLLWRPPPKYYGDIYPGYKGLVVKWLDEKLSIIMGSEPRSGKNLVYDKLLLEQVKSFQFDRGLSPDGVVGPQTIININDSVDGGDPMLKPKKG